MSSKIAAVVQKFRSFMQASYTSIHVPDDWLGQCAEFIIDQFQNESIDSYVKMVHQQLLNFDLNEVGAKCLPEDLGSRQTGFLEGNHFLQVSLCIDNTQSYFSILQKLKGTENENALVSADNDNNILATFSSTYYQQPQNQTNRQEKRNRLYTLYLTDGRTHVTAVEKRPISFLNDEIWPGTKIALCGKIMISGGVLFIGPENLKILGGIVDGWNSNECLIKTIEKALSEKLDFYHPRDINSREKTATLAELSSNVKKQPSSQQTNFKQDVKPVIKQNPSQIQITSPILVKQSTSQSKSCSEPPPPPLNELNEDEFLMNFNPESLIKQAAAPVQNIRKAQSNSMPKKPPLTSVPKMKIEIEEDDDECLMVLNQLESQSRVKINPETSGMKRLPSSNTISSIESTTSNANNHKKVKTGMSTVQVDQDDEDFMFMNDIDENYNQYSSKAIHKAPTVSNKPVTVEQPSNSMFKVNKLSDLTDQTFISRCCRANFDADSILATCSHQVKQCHFLTLVGTLQQFKHKWYQECVVCCKSEPSVRLNNTYLGDEPLCKLLEMTAKEARDLHRKSLEVMDQQGDQNQYVKYFEHKRKACELQLEKMTCHVTFKFDFTRKKFCIVNLDGVTLNR